MFGVDLKRIASASGLGNMLGLGGGLSASERPRNSDGAGPSAGGREEDEDEEAATHEKTATTNLISAGHESFELIFMMLMGIRTSVGRFCAQAQARELAATDFEQQWEGDFLGKGSAETPAHGHYDFRFKDYAPLVFRQIRERFGVMTEDYMLSLTSEYVLVRHACVRVYVQCARAPRGSSRAGARLGAAAACLAPCVHTHRPHGTHTHTACTRRMRPSPYAAGTRWRCSPTRSRAPSSSTRPTSASSSRLAPSARPPSS